MRHWHHAIMHHCQIPRLVLQPLAHPPRPLLLPSSSPPHLCTLQKNFSVAAVGVEGVEAAVPIPVPAERLDDHLPLVLQIHSLAGMEGPTLKRMEAHSALQSL